MIKKVGRISFIKVAYNVQRLCVVVDFKAQKFNLAQKLIGVQKLSIGTSATITQNLCYVPLNSEL